MTPTERRRFPRVALPTLYRPAGLLGPRRPARDVSQGGIRVNTDEALSEGTRLEIEMFLPDGSSLTVDVRVAWIRELAGEDSRYEAGLEFLAMDPIRAAQLERCLKDFGSG